MVSTSTSARPSATTCRVADTPSRRGICTSISTRSGRSSRASATASLAVRRLADHLDVRRAAQDEHQPGPYGGLVLGDQHPDRHASYAFSFGDGQCGPDPPDLAVPPCVSGPASNVPPSSATRSRMPTRPAPEPGARGPGPVAVRAGHRARSSEPVRPGASATVTRPGAACLRALVSDSWTMRYAASSTGAGSGAAVGRASSRVKSSPLARRSSGLLEQRVEPVERGRGGRLRVRRRASRSSRSAGASRPAPRRCSRG